MQEESFEHRFGISLTVSDSFWAQNEELIALMPSKFQTDSFVLTVVNSDGQAGNQDFKTNPNEEIWIPSLCSRVSWVVLQNLISKYILQAATS